MVREDSRAAKRRTAQTEPALPRPPGRHHLVLRLLQRHPTGADLSMEPQFVAVLDCCLCPVLEPQVVGRRGMAAEPERDQMIELVILRGARQAIRELALDGVRHLPRWAHLGRVAALADRVVDRGLGHVGSAAPGTGARWWSWAAAGDRISPELSSATSPTAAPAPRAIRCRTPNAGE
jgi:hypothetical protein